MRRRFGFSTMVLTLALSLLGLLLCSFLREDALTARFPFRVAYCALWFALPLVLGLAGMEESLWLNRKRFRPARRRGVVLGFLAAAVLSSVIGGVGGALYTLDNKVIVEEITVRTGKKANHIVLLIDGSDSVQQDKAEIGLAACGLIDALDEEVSMQAAFFTRALTAEDVRYRTDYLPLEDGVKEEFKEFIQNMDIVGGTCFEGPLRLALDTLEGRAGRKEAAVIIMLTDGDGEMSDSLARDVEKSGALLYTVRINPSDSADARRLAKLAEATGGEDLTVESGDSDELVEDLLDAFQRAVGVKTEEETHTELVSEEVLLPGGGGGAVTAWRIAVRMISYALYALLIQWAYYRRITPAGLILGVVAGLFTGYIIFLNELFSIPATAVLLLTAYTIYEEKGETAHV